MCFGKYDEEINNTAQGGEGCKDYSGRMIEKMG